MLIDKLAQDILSYRTAYREVMEECGAEAAEEKLANSEINDSEFDEAVTEQGDISEEDIKTLEQHGFHAALELTPGYRTGWCMVYYHGNGMCSYITRYNMRAEKPADTDVELLPYGQWCLVTYPMRGDDEAGPDVVWDENHMVHIRHHTALSALSHFALRQLRAHHERGYRPKQPR